MSDTNNPSTIDTGRVMVLMDALRLVLVKAGVLRPDADPSGPELLLAADGYAGVPQDDGSQMPPWAAGKASSYTDTGAVLPTRDGRKIGNATLLYQTIEPCAGPIGIRPSGLYVVVTDAGNFLRLTLAELREMFHEPQWVKRI